MLAFFHELQHAIQHLNFVVCHPAAVRDGCSSTSPFPEESNKTLCLGARPWKIRTRGQEAFRINQNTHQMAELHSTESQSELKY